MRYRGSVVDTLVFLLVALLLPAWLLGHLFLTYFPAPASATVATTATASKSAGLSNPRSVTALPLPTKPRPKPNPAGAALAASSNAVSSVDVAKQQQAAASLKLKLDQLRSENNSLKEQAASAARSTSELARQENLIADLRGKLKTSMDKLATARAAATNKLEANEPAAQVTALTSQLQTAESRAKQLAAQVDSLTAKNDQLTQAYRKVSAAQDEASEYKTRAQQLQQKLSDANTELSRQQELIKSMRSSSVEAASKTDAEQEALRLQQVAMDKAKQVKVDLKNKLSKLSDELRNANSNLAERERELSTVRSSMEALKSQQQNALAIASDAQGSNTKNANKNNSAETATSPPVDTIKLEPSLSSQTADAEVYRDFTSSRGNRSKLAFIRWEDDKVIVRSFVNRKLYLLPLSRFSEPDQQYLLQLK